MAKRPIYDHWRRKADGAIFECMQAGNLEDYGEKCYRFVRVGPVGEHRRKRRWIEVGKLRLNYEHIGDLHE